MSNKRKVFCLLLVILATCLSFSLSSAADKLDTPAVGAAPGDVPEIYELMDVDLAYNGFQPGDFARADIQAVGTGAQYVALILNGVVPNANAIAPHLFLKVGQADASGNFHYGACYLGNNGSSGHFGPMQSQGRFNLSQPFNSARMVAARLDDLVRIKFTNVDNGTKPDQVYSCNNAPAPDPAGTKIGVASSGSAARIDNFGDHVAVRDTFTYNGALGSTGNWVDIDPGMVANGSSATGGNGAQSLWSCPPRHIDLRLDAQGKLEINYSAGNVAQKIMIYRLLDDDTVVPQGPFNRPAGGCELIATGVQLTNPPYLLALAVMGDQQDGGNAILDVQVAPPPPPQFPPILLVDDDDNVPDVRGTYTAVLDGMGLEYDIWDTNNSDNEPDAATLQQYDVVIWFTGDEFGGAAGPGAAGEAALTTYLSVGGCFFISSQDYVWDRGITTFMQSYLGVGLATSDVSQTTVTGADVYAGLGPYTLAYPFTNYSDRLTPIESAAVAFNGNQGGAAVRSGTHKAVFLGYPFEALPVAGRTPVMQTTLGWCASQ